MTSAIIVAVIVIVAVAVALLIAIPIACRTAVANKEKLDAQTIGTAEEKARNIIDEALKAAE